MTNKMVFFDCDETLWESVNAEHISSVKSEIKQLDNKTLIRIKDNKKFILKRGVREAFKYLFDNKAIIGIVSDNHPEQVILALKIFGLWKYINKKAVNIKLWVGYCPKDQMILDTLSKNFKDLTIKSVYLVDDKDYTEAAQKSHLTFIRVNSETDLLKEVKKKIVVYN